MTKHARTASTLIALALMAGGCARTTRQGTDFSNNRGPTENRVFTERDANVVYAGMVDDCLSKPWADRWFEQTDELPKMFVGTVRVAERERIDTLQVTRQIEEELINSGRVRVLADKSQREELREERLDQRVFTRESDIKLLANELGADFIMIGRIGTQRYRQEAGGRVTYFQVNLELLDIETGEKVWAQTEEIRKVAS